MSLKDVPVRARLWAPDRSLPRFFGRLLLFFVRFNLTSFAQYLRAAETRGGVAQACRATPSGDEDVRKCCPSEPCCTLGRRRCTKVLPKRAVLYPRATKMYESVAQARRAALLGNDKCGFRRRRVSFIHTSFCPAPLGNGKARKSRLTVPRVTFGCGTVRRHRSRRARCRPLLLSLEGFRGVGRMVVRPLYRPLYPAYSFDIYCCPLKVSEQRDIHPQCCCNGIADDFSEGKPLS